jgi:SAM-dependent methyltransferase
VLELACGTGRLTIPLSSLGVRVTGLDAPGPMLERARRKASTAGCDIDFVQGDMRDFELGQLFSLIIVSCNSFGHLTQAGEIRAALRAIRRHLAPGGLIAFDVVNPRLEALRSGSVRNRLDKGPNPCAAISVDGRAYYDPVSQVTSLDWLVCEPGGVPQTIRFKLRVFFPEELRLLLERSGFKVVNCFGDFSCNPPSEESLVQICVARADD